MQAEIPQTIMMTGATGFLGQYILRDLLDKGLRIVALLRAPWEVTTERLKGYAREIGFDLEDAVARNQLILVPGGLPDDLPEPTWGRTDAILNCAASLQLFTNGNQEPYDTNVAGTQAILEWAELHNVTQIHAVSTAYTCGWNNGLIPERFHKPEPQFQTHYEKSKWLAERLLEQWADAPGRSLTLYRPSFLIGDSQTGYTSQYAGFYQFARLVSMLKRQFAGNDHSNANGHANGNGHSHGNGHDDGKGKGHGERTYIPLRIPGRPEDRQNIVPIDFASRIIAEIVPNPSHHGRIYHLTNPKGPTNDMMKRCYEEFFSLHGGYFAEPGEVIGHCSQAESLLWDQYDLLTPRVVHTPNFDISNTRRVMEASDIHFPELTPERVYMLFDYAANRDWGRNGNGKSHGKTNGKTNARQR